jgi:hypothetical protein
MNYERLKEWFEGKLGDDELTNKEVRWLEKRVFNAISKKMLERPDVITFAAHPTLQ